MSELIAASADKRADTWKAFCDDIHITNSLQPQDGDEVMHKDIWIKYFQQELQAMNKFSMSVVKETAIYYLYEQIKQTSSQANLTFKTLLLNLINNDKVRKEDKKLVRDTLKQLMESQKSDEASDKMHDYSQKLANIIRYLYNNKNPEATPSQQNTHDCCIS